jgi:hypothetical protein
MIPTHQKFYRGHRVRLGEMPKMMAHFPGNCDAIVIGSYNDTCGLGGHGLSEDHTTVYNLLLLDAAGKPHNSVSWYYDHQMTMLDRDRDAGEALIQQYITAHYSKIVWET